MIETPAAVFSIEGILDRVDFVSLGTNDLTQLILAADRNQSELLGFYSVLHPAVLRAVDQVVKVCRDREVPVSICGEAAGDPGLTSLLVGLGLLRLSMSANRAAKVRRSVRRLRISDAEALSRMAVASRSTDQVKAMLQDFAKAALGDEEGAVEMQS